MPRKRVLSPLPIFDQEALEAFLVERKQKVSHAVKIWQYLLFTPNASLETIDRVENLPKVLWEPLRKHFVLFTTKVVRATTSTDQTHKLLIELQDGLRVETVVISKGASTARRPEGEDGVTICVSSQVGCKMGCHFCATGSMGELGSLYAGEIIEQLVHARRWANVRNVVFMGMGEPFNNYRNMVHAVRGMLDPKRFALSGKRITVSTVGVTQKSIQQFTADLPHVSLAISLHAPNQELRASLTNAARGLPLPKLMAAVDNHLEKTKKKVMVEYVMLKGVNDSIAVAHELGKLLMGKNVVVNLIPYNITNVERAYEPTEAEGIRAFKEILCKVYGLYTNVRTEKGGDVAAACGQLVVQSMKPKGAAGNTGKVADIEDMMASADPTGTSPPVEEGTEEDLVRMHGTELYKRGLVLWPSLAHNQRSDIKQLTSKMQAERGVHIRLYAILVMGTVAIVYMWYRTGLLLGLYDGF